MLGSLQQESSIHHSNLAVLASDFSVLFVQYFRCEVPSRPAALLDFE